MRIFVDTNVLFDVFAQREPFFEASQKLLVMQAFGDAELWAAPQSYLDIFYVLRKGCAADELQDALAKSLERINLCATDHADVLAACTGGWNDVEDALIGVAAKKVGADYLLTRDEGQPGFARLGIPVLTPEAFFDLLRDEHDVTYDTIDL